MKKFLTFYFALVLSVAQGFAASIDSLRNETSGFGISNFRDGLGIGDGFALKDTTGTVDGLMRIDDLNLDTGVTGVNTNSSTKKVIDVYQAGNKISSLHYSMTAGKTVTKEITVKTSNIKKDMTVELSGDSEFKIVDGVSELDHNKTNSSSGVKLKITFFTVSSGYYTAKLVIKEKGFLGKKKTITITGTANSIIIVSKTSLNFAAAGKLTFTVRCERTGYDNNLILDLKGSDAKLFKVTPKVISWSDAGDENTITVTFTPKYGTYKANAYISIYCEHDDISKLVYLSYNGQGYEAPSVDFIVLEDENQEKFTEEQEAGASSAEDYTAVDEDGMQQDDKILTMDYPTTGLDEMLSDVRIFAENQTIVIDSPISHNAIISDLTGRSRNVSLQVGRNEIPVNANGIHIVRVGDKSKKLMIR